MKLNPSPTLIPLDLTRAAGGGGGKSTALSPSDLDPLRMLSAPAPTQHERIEREAQVWVSQTFFGTLLKQMQDSPFKSELFSGGRGGEAFASLYHQQLADKMARASGSKLVNSIVRQVEAKAAYDKNAQKAPPVEAAERKNPTNLDPRPERRAEPKAQPGAEKSNRRFSLAA